MKYDTTDRVAQLASSTLAQRARGGRRRSSSRPASPSADGRLPEGRVHLATRVVVGGGIGVGARVEDPVGQLVVMQQRREAVPAELRPAPLRGGVVGAGEQSAHVASNSSSADLRRRARDRREMSLSRTANVRVRQARLLRRLAHDRHLRGDEVRARGVRDTAGRPGTDRTRSRSTRRRTAAAAVRRAAAGAARVAAHHVVPGHVGHDVGGDVVVAQHVHAVLALQKVRFRNSTRSQLGRASPPGTQEAVTRRRSACLRRAWSATWANDRSSSIVRSSSETVRSPMQTRLRYTRRFARERSSEQVAELGRADRSWRCSHTLTRCRSMRVKVSVPQRRAVDRRTRSSRRRDRSSASPRRAARAAPSSPAPSRSAVARVGDLS